jgi:hypothetical protein
MIYTVKDEFTEAWGSKTTSEKEVYRLSVEWEKPVSALMGQLEPFDSDKFLHDSIMESIKEHSDELFSGEKMNLDGIVGLGAETCAKFEELTGETLSYDDCAYVSSLVDDCLSEYGAKND